MPAAVTAVPEVCIDGELLSCCPQPRWWEGVKGIPEFSLVPRFLVPGNFEGSDRNCHREHFPHEATIRVDSQTIADAGWQIHWVPEISSCQLVWEGEFYVPCLFSSVRIKYRVGGKWTSIITRYPIIKLCYSHAMNVSHRGFFENRSLVNLNCFILYIWDSILLLYIFHLFSWW